MPPVGAQWKAWRVSADPVVKPAAQTRAESRVLNVRKQKRERDRLSAGGLEGDGFEPSVPLVSRGAIRREFPKRGARLAASWGVELRRSSIWEFDPTSRDQTRGILLRHLDDAVQPDGEMAV